MKQDIQHMLEKAGITGVTSAAIGVGLLGTNNYYQIPGTNTTVPLPLITCVVGMANSFVTDGIHTLINEHVPLGKKTKDRASLGINAAVSGLSFFVLLHLAGSDVPYQYNMINAFLTGALGEVSGSASYEYLVDNLYF